MGSLPISDLANAYIAAAAQRERLESRWLIVVSGQSRPRRVNLIIKLKNQVKNRLPSPVFPQFPNSPAADNIPMFFLCRTDRIMLT
jgi:hypothetical protein